jgi:hypothetical protein
MMSFRRALLRRSVGAAVVAGVAVSALAGCEFLAPQDTLQIKEVADGVNATVGDVFVGNAVLVAGEDGTANLVTTLYNKGAKKEQVEFVPSGGEPLIVQVGPNALRKLGDPADQRSQVGRLDAKPGSLAKVAVTSGGETVGMRIPVVSASLPPYSSLTPTPIPSPTVTPKGTGSATPTPTPSPTPSR